MEISDEEDQLIDTLTREVLGGEQPPSLAEKIVSRALSRQAAVRRWVRAAIAAAAVLMASLIGWHILGAGYPAPKVSRAGGPPAGEPIPRGTLVRTQGAPATVSLGGYCRIELEQQSALRIEGREYAEEVSLASGGALFEVDPKVGSFVVRTEVGTVSVTGTKFSVRIVDRKGVQAMTGKQMFVRVLVGAVVLSGAWGQRALQAGEETAVKEPAAASTVTGTVVMACPKGMFIKVKTEKEESMFPVMGEATQTAVKALKAGDSVQLTTVVCPKTHKVTVTKVEKSAAP
jgi:ferric-dicitrate binding protein FerR (iron transport regulator)